jgi:hypothetical protein
LIFGCDFSEIDFIGLKEELDFYESKGSFSFVLSFSCF